MARNKPMPKKVRMMKITKGNRRVPAWIMMRTARKFLRHPKRHNWRRGRRKV